MLPALKILVDVLDYRLRRLEMANLAGAVSVMLALRLSLGEIAVRSLFALILNVLAYLINDVLDLERDLASGRAPDKTRFLAEHKRSALAAEAALALALVVIALWFEPWLLVPGVLGAGICWIYTAYLKRTPLFDVLAMTLWGAAMPLCAISPESKLGWALIALLALFSTCFELIQVLRDRPGDAALDIRTTAVHFGPERTLLALRVVMLLSALYAIVVLHRFIAVALLLAPLLPGRGDPERYWNRVRVVFGLTWLALLVAIAVSGSSHGALLSLSR
jgi:4-hydroxybenzoate polyprenyltransferase